MTMTSYPLTVPMPVLKLPLLTTDPLTAGELFSHCGVRIVALPLAPAMDAPGAATLGEVGGLGASPMGAPRKPLTVPNTRSG